MPQKKLGTRADEQGSFTRSDWQFRVSSMDVIAQDAINAMGGCSAWANAASATRRQAAIDAYQRTGSGQLNQSDMDAIFAEATHICAREALNAQYARQKAERQAPVSKVAKAGWGHWSGWWV